MVARSGSSSAAVVVVGGLRVLFLVVRRVYDIVGKPNARFVYDGLW